MGNLLRSVGHDVRIICGSPSPFSITELKRVTKQTFLKMLGQEANDWLVDFSGEIEFFRHELDELKFQPGEIVIGIGSLSALLLQKMRQKVIKIRYCHGFAGDKMEKMEPAWGPPMLTFAVSDGLVPKLEKISKSGVYAMVPNGVDTSLYYPDQRYTRDGFGTIFNQHYNKAPEFTLEVMKTLREKYVGAPQYVFGVARRPPELPAESYTRFPPIDVARQLYSRSRVWIIASRFEGSPLPMLEAMACGCVLVTTNHDGIPGLIEDGKNALVVPIGDLKALVGSVSKVHENEDLRQKLVRGGRETVDKFTWQAALEKMESTLYKIIDEQGIA